MANSKPIVEKENAHESLKKEIMMEGCRSFNKGEDFDCPYAEGSTFYKWYRQGYCSTKQVIKNSY